jgi:formamidopyrimidine-DNA glycosylase
MPELPEVETIARALREGGRGGEPVVGRVAQRAHLLWARTLAHPQPEEFFARLPGQRILEVGRRGKFLILSLSSGSLLIHLRMSGDLRVEPAAGPGGEPLPHLPHDRLVIDFADGARLAFNDARKFGRAWLVDDPLQVVGGLGPEPFDPQFTPEAFYQRLGRTRRQIKPLLLDQAFLAGLGNIYTDEALHQAFIHPLRPADSLSPDEAARLWAAIRAVLQEGIRRNGASFDWVYRGGDFQNSFAVYQRTGLPCPHCGAVIVRITAGQRGTHFCPTCQPPPFSLD